MSTIKLIDIYKVFKDGDNTVHALFPTSFTIEKNEFGAIIGPSGSGKSTLLTMIGALQEPSGGKLYIDDVDIALLNDKQKAKLRFEKIGFVLQSANLLPFLKINEQLELKAKYAKKRYDQKESNKLLTQLGIEKLADKYPNKLSGGERQRAAIAYALYGDPVLILADEPTASLDGQKSLEVVALLKEIAKKQNKAVIMVTHDNRLLHYCDRILKIEDGVLQEVAHSEI